MALNIRSPETEALAAELARLTGETKTEAVTKFHDQWQAKRDAPYVPKPTPSPIGCAALPVIALRAKL